MGAMEQVVGSVAPVRRQRVRVVRVVGEVSGARKGTVPSFFFAAQPPARR